tara:strand:- start:573 stop:1166 length:594 start_codon:yes stop_codon:yes gene_type:complete
MNYEDEFKNNIDFTWGNLETVKHGKWTSFLSWEGIDLECEIHKKKNGSFSIDVIAKEIPSFLTLETAYVKVDKDMFNFRNLDFHALYSIYIKIKFTLDCRSNGDSRFLLELLKDSLKPLIHKFDKTNELILYLITSTYNGIESRNATYNCNICFTKNSVNKPNPCCRRYFLCYLCIKKIERNGNFKCPSCRIISKEI